MKSKGMSLLMIVVLGAILSVALLGKHKGTLAAETSVKRWEHLALTVDAAQGVGNAETSQQIVKLGAQGWELVDVATFVKDGTTTKIVYCFKRPG